MESWITKEEILYKQPGKVLDVKKDNNQFVILCEKGIMRISILSKSCIRVIFNSRGKFLNIPSFAVINEPICNDFNFTIDSDELSISTGLLNIKVKTGDSRIAIFDMQGRSICEDDEYSFLFSKGFVKCKKKANNSTHYYGLGEKTGYLDKRGRKYVMWNTDDPLHTPTKDPLYKSIPLLIAFNDEYSYGLFVDKTCRMSFDLGEESEEYYTFEVQDDEMDYYFMHGPDIKSVVGNYSELTGKMELPPLWALGYQQCRWSYYPEETVLKIAQNFREKQIPCDAIYLDIDYMDGYRVFTWNENRFPDPEKMIKRLKNDGFKVVTIIDPGVKKDADYEVYMEGIKNDHFCKQASGEIYHGKVWPGDAAFPDFTKQSTRKWWGEKHKVLLDKGVAGIWNDMNEPSDFSVDSHNRMECTVPNDVMMWNDGYPGTFARYHNSYGLNMCRATYEGFKSIKPEDRPFIVTRSAYAGIQRYAAVWTGDNHSWWEHLAASIPMFLNIGLSGVPFVGGDVGGFQDNATPELFARWMQLGCFTPFFRGHSNMGTKPHEPWAFGSEVEEICKEYIKLRYSLLPYVYNEFYKASLTGIPVMRPLVLEFPQDENVHNLCDQFLFGENIMVAPVYRPSTYKRCVYLPDGIWYNYWTDEVYEGNNYVTVDAQLDVLPVFIRQNSIIPSVEPQNYVGEKVAETLILDIYATGDFSYSFYEDDGFSNKYKQGEYSITNFSAKLHEDALNFKIEPIRKNYISGRKNYLLRFHNINRTIAQVLCRDEHSFSYNDEQKILTVNIKDTGNNQVCEIKF
ncbi:MAG TPA: DUF4968 domain-containing protein [Clostridiaceae bacterium]|nr:DUF4968 domain-containing protein [Clostridiaceae bacterium]